MKRAILPNQREDYIPSGIYKEPLQERKTEFMKKFNNAEETDDMPELRMKICRELRRE